MPFLWPRLQYLLLPLGLKIQFATQQWTTRKSYSSSRNNTSVLSHQKISIYLHQWLSFYLVEQFNLNNGQIRFFWIDINHLMREPLTKQCSLWLKARDSWVTEIILPMLAVDCVRDNGCQKIYRSLTFSGLSNEVFCVVWPCPHHIPQNDFWPLFILFTKLVPYDR